MPWRINIYLWSRERRFNHEKKRAEGTMHPSVQRCGQEAWRSNSHAPLWLPPKCSSSTQKLCGHWSFLSSYTASIVPRNQILPCQALVLATISSPGCWVYWLLFDNPKSQSHYLVIPLLFFESVREKALIILAPRQVSKVFFPISAVKIKGPQMLEKPDASHLSVANQIYNTDHRPPRSSVSLILLNG